MLPEFDSIQEWANLFSDEQIWKPFYNDSSLCEEFDKKVKKVFESKEWPKSRNKEKGTLLEELIKFIMSRFEIVKDIQNNRSTVDNELDLHVLFNENIPIPFICNIKSKLICECKNMKSKTVDVGMVSKLVELCDKNNAGLGIFVSLNGLSGTGWKFAEGKRRKLYLSTKIPIISFTIDEIEQLKNKGFNFYTIIKNKLNALVDEMDYSGGEFSDLCENDEDFLVCLHENLDSFEKLCLITQEEKELIISRINTKYRSM